MQVILRHFSPVCFWVIDTAYISCHRWQSAAPSHSLRFSFPLWLCISRRYRAVALRLRLGDAHSRWGRVCRNMQIFAEISITVLERLHLSDRVNIYVCQCLFMACCQIIVDSTKIYTACIYYLVGSADTVTSVKYLLYKKR